jgi:hypothetical protein
MRLEAGHTKADAFAEEVCAFLGRECEESADLVEIALALLLGRPAVVRARSKEKFDAAQSNRRRNREQSSEIPRGVEPEFNM